MIPTLADIELQGGILFLQKPDQVSCNDTHNLAAKSIYQGDKLPFSPILSVLQRLSKLLAPQNWSQANCLGRSGLTPFSAFRPTQRQH